MYMYKRTVKSLLSERAQGLPPRRSSADGGARGEDGTVSADSPELVLLFTVRLHGGIAS